ncbi:hypothetical protein [Actinoplanes derwentensis]|uniref:Uncharacterized protein n=1 Tax=Actinoplanes derwentensis TaxID=113562 RepID=A0A1H1RXS6_9ACTN|nr:hypothetical protein [Actinoplanes derwentensis]GID84548.1 hypothetical protein Ade03nite_34720 [Actinoplanes derwentensis]SDS40428.1 hypothetical protein SAMN04489716_0711 [Actinoplanes derwentensis]
MLVQWGIKGLWLPDDASAKRIIDSHVGIISNWWYDAGTISQADKPKKLTPANLDMHVNHFNSPDPAAAGRRFSEVSPFISIACGTVSRDVAARTNESHSALETALLYGTRFGAENIGYLYRCWVIVGPRAAVEVEGVAEEVRDLNTYRRYFAFQNEGEVTAKVVIPVNHIQQCEKWIWYRAAKEFRLDWVHSNPAFTKPDTLSNVRELI